MDPALESAESTARPKLAWIALRLAAGWAWLLGWHVWFEGAGCPIALLFLVPVALFLLLGVTEAALLRRRAALSMYLRPDAGLYRLLRGGVLLLAWQTLKAIGLGLVLLVGAAAWGRGTWAVLAADAVLLAVLYRVAVSLVGSQARAGFAGMLARRLLMPLNAGLLLVALVLLTLHSAHPDLRGLTLVEALDSRISAVSTACDGVAILARGAATFDALGWWLAETQLTRAELIAVAPFAWAAFVAATLGFVWAYSRLLLGMLVSPAAVQHLLRRQEHPEAAA
jgi:hypothetical protein